MNIDHEANFVQKALHNFDLFAENYFDYINFETIKAEINDACKTDLGEYNLNIGLKNLKKLYLPFWQSNHTHTRWPNSTHGDV